MSREEGLYKDKIEVSLDGRQIFYLFFGGAVIVGLVFVLGVMVGRRVEARGHVERAQTQAAVDPLAALDRLEGGGGLSFQGALRGSGEAPTSDVEKTIGEMAKAKAKEPAGKKPAPAAGVPVAEVKKAEEPKAEAKADQPKSEPKQDLKQDPKQDPKQAKKVAAEAPKSDKKAEDKRAAEVDRKSSDKEFLAKLEARSDKKAPAEDKKPADADKPAEKKAKYTLQLSSFQDKGEATAYLTTMKSNGFSPYLTEAEVDGKTYYRIRLGNYRSIDAANDAKADVEKATKKSASVMKL
jgi:DedD protein